VAVLLLTRKNRLTSAGRASWTATKHPETLLEAVIYFANAKVTHDALVALRWPIGRACPACNVTEVYLLSTKRKCKRQH
jgi:hypothetical protein